VKGKIIISEYHNQLMGFLYEDDSLYEVHSFDNEKNNLGSIYTARVENIVDNIDAAFVSIDRDTKCYYSLKDNEDKHIKLDGSKKEGVSIGDTILVQIVKEEIKQKKAESTSNISITGKYVIVNRTGVIGISSKIKSEALRENLKNSLAETLDNYDKSYNFGTIVRTAATEVSAEILNKEACSLLEKLKNLIDKAHYLKPHQVVYSTGNQYIDFFNKCCISGRYESIEVITEFDDLYEELLMFRENELSNDIEAKVTLYKNRNVPIDVTYNITRDVNKALQRVVYLKSGAYLVFDHTEALTAIDVNTGKAVKGRDTEEHILKINIEAAVMIAKMMRLKNLSGIIIVDFINMKKQESRAELIKVIEEELSRDTVKNQFVDFTGLGLCEITRKKLTKPIYEIL